MARITFRQGIVRYQSDLIGTPTFLAPSTTANAIDLIVSPDPTQINFADETEDYLYEEPISVQPAWINIPTGPTQSWLYWDIDALTGERTFGFTNIQPITDSAEPISPAIDLHWFDTTRTQMFVFNGNRFVPKIRVFAARVQSTSVIDPMPLGTQAGILDTVFSGHILFDDDNIAKPVKRFDRRGRGKFLTTETPVLSQFSKLASFKLEPALVDGKAIEPLPIFHCVSYKGPREIGLASHLQPQFPCIGITREESASGEVRTFLTSGYITDDSFTFTEPAGSALFVGQTGEIVTAPPQVISIQQIGVVVDANTILVSINPLIHYEEVI